MFDLAAHGVATVGAVATGLPTIGLPAVGLSDLTFLAAGAAGIVFLAVGESLGAGRSFAARHNYEVDPDQELIGLGAANLASGFFGGFSVDASLSQTATGEALGREDPGRVLLTSVLVLATAVFLAPLFSTLPQAVLGAIVIASILSLVDLGEMRRYWAWRRSDAALAAIALIGVLTTSVLAGLVIAVLISLSLLLYRASRPYVAELARLAGEPPIYSDRTRHPNATPATDLLLARIDAPLYFFNVTVARSQLLAMVDARDPRPRGLTSISPPRPTLTSLRATCCCSSNRTSPRGRSSSLLSRSRVSCETGCAGRVSWTVSATTGCTEQWPKPSRPSRSGSPSGPSCRRQRKTHPAQVQRLPADLAIFALLLAVYGLIAKKLDQWSIGPAMAFVAIGLVTAADSLGFISIAPATETVKLLAEGALTLLLFSDASDIGGRDLRHDAATFARLLLIGLPLTILLGTISAALLFPGISIGLALLIASALAPTDAALGQPVVTNEAVPARIRRLLNVESGLNDGIATPIVFLAIGLTAAEASGHSGWLTDAVVASVVGAVVGVAIGAIGGFLVDIALRRGCASGASSQLSVLALAVACYVTAVALNGNGFIAAFVGGLAFGTATRRQDERSVRFTETQGSLLAIGVWASFGLILAGELRDSLWNPTAIVYAVLSLTVIRMLPVALALIGARFKSRTVLFMGWFGPRGLASIVFLIIGIEGLDEAHIDPGPLTAVISWTVLLSVVVHGLSAGPFAARFGRWAKTLPVTAGELEESDPLHSQRVAWGRDGLAPVHAGSPTRVGDPAQDDAEISPRSSP